MSITLASADAEAVHVRDKVSIVGIASGRTPRSRRMPARTAATVAESHGLGSSCARCAAARLPIVTGRNSRSASAARNARLERADGRLDVVEVELAEQPRWRAGGVVTQA